MTFRRRLTLLIAGTVAFAIVLASGLGYLAVRGQLRSEVDSSLRARAVEVVREVQVNGFSSFQMPVEPGDPDAYAQLITVDGRAGLTTANTNRIPLPVGDTAKLVAAGRREATLYDARVGPAHVRVLAIPVQNGGAVAFGRSLREVDHILHRLRWIFILAALGGVALAVVLGRTIAVRMTTPLRRLTQTAEHVAQTRDLAQRMDASGADEIASMATSFNAMLDALEISVGELDASVRAQRQLVADASHELRTPITSLRTNVEILRTRFAELPAERRDMLLDTVVEQTEELTVLMNDVIELARGDHMPESREPVHVDEILGEALARTARHAPDTVFDATIEETTVLGAASRLTRAVNNLLDNAVRWNAPGQPIEVALHDNVLRVRDHGPGIPEDELDHVFDRFFRGAHTREQTGSGLGLAIVRQVAEDHGGTVTVANAGDGGAVFTLTLPPAPAATEATLADTADAPASAAS
ncbi:MAG TPA: HAMP domain-containing sensor histidine kinase [Solirubrobacteraceae bacterium]|nr:HAMP domain-containing sensor histidine kinase [Solirubrobacteraceae bacterium]